MISKLKRMGHPCSFYIGKATMNCSIIEDARVCLFLQEKKQKAMHKDTRHKRLICSSSPLSPIPWLMMLQVDYSSKAPLIFSFSTSISFDNDGYEAQDYNKRTLKENKSFEYFEQKNLSLHVLPCVFQSLYNLLYMTTVSIFKSVFKLTFNNLLLYDNNQLILTTIIGGGKIQKLKSC